MTIDRAIHDLKVAYASDYNKQLAEWLEELKELRSYKEKIEMQYLDDINNPLEPLKLTSDRKSVEDIDMLDFTVIYALKHCLEEALKESED